jgi:hypothetical protein
MNHSTSAAPRDHVSRFLVGIDLGTTNTVVCYVDTEGDSVIREFSVPQLVAAGEVGTAVLLPSFCYLAAGPELPPGALALPWEPNPRLAVGVFARDQGTAVPERLVSSAKSWLAHAGVDRTRGILPWGSDLGDEKLSPVDVSFRYLDHISRAWDHSFGQMRDRQGTPTTLAEQHVILTVPASFDEVARQLTVEAARRAGMEHLTLIEEPLAAFYAWLAKHENSWQERLKPGETVLVVDVGGGTTDFSLISIDAGPTLRRTAVGDHLLLGGDNIDMTLARLAEKAWNTRLPTRQWFMLCQMCRRAKEALLTTGGPFTHDIAVSGPGSSVVAGTRTHRFSRAEVEQLVLDGFFPEVSGDSPPPERRRGIQEMGLPYAPDAAVTRHLLQFLRDAAPLAGAPVGGPLIPSAILFNGGALLPPQIRQRVCAVVGQWGGGPPVPEMEAVDLNLAVSRGAAYYGLVRRGEGVRVRGGLARAYYMQVERANEPGWLCVLPHDVDEGVVQHLAEQRFLVRTNQPVRFPLACSATRLGDRPGEVLKASEDLMPLLPLHTALRYGRGNQDALPVSVAAVLNEVGTLDLWLQSSTSEHRYPLVFDLRGPAAAASPNPVVCLTVDEAAVQAAERLLQEAFGPQGDPTRVLRRMEEALALPRDDWSVTILRRFVDSLLNLAESRAHSARHEARWLNLTGFCLRPGFGAPGDDWRVSQTWKLWHRGALAAQPQVAAEWWVLWRRLAAGLKLGQQQQIGGGLVSALVPKATERLPSGRKAAGHDHLEKWRCLGSLERLDVRVKTQVLEALLLTPSRLEDVHYWVLARLGARRLFHGPADGVIPARTVAALLARLRQRCEADHCPPAGLFAVANVARLCGIRDLELPDEDRAAALALLRDAKAPEAWTALLTSSAEASAEVTTELVGDRLPLGLSLAWSEPPEGQPRPTPAAVE